MDTNLQPTQHPFNIDVAKRFWESDNNDCKPGHFNLELYLAYLRVIYG